MVKAKQTSQGQFFVLKARKGAVNTSVNDSTSIEIPAFQETEE